MISLFNNDQIVRAYTKEKVEEGRAEGKKETAIETAKRMLLKAMPTDLIAELSGLPLAEVNALKAQMVH